MRKICLKTAAYCFNNQPVEEIVLFSNGSFSVVTAGKVCYLFDEFGKLFLPRQRYFECGAVLANGYCLLKENDDVLYALYNNLWQPVYQGIEDIKVFANDWYELQVGAYKRLFNAEHQLMAEDYGQCKVFNVGYCLDIDGDGIVWNQYLPDGQLVSTEWDIVCFLGDGNRLQQRPGCCSYDVVGFDGRPIAESVTKEVKQFANGRFVVQFEENGCMQMFEPNGERLSVKVRDGEFLADGRFMVFQEAKHRLVRLYDENGIISKVDVWRLQEAGNFYVVESEGVLGRLFDENKNVCGDDYCLVGAAECFSWFEHNGKKLELFNRNGLVFSSDEI